VDLPAQGVAFVGWLEIPHVLFVYGEDVASARKMTEAVIGAYD